MDHDSLPPHLSTLLGGAAGANMVRRSQMHRDISSAAWKARKCLPPAIGRVVSDRILDLEITGWLDGQRLWKELIDEVMKLPEPEEGDNHGGNSSAAAVRQ